MTDRRTAKTKKAIREAFLSQLKNNSLNQITVSKIVDIANIARGTFYLHYLDITDLYDSLVKELFNELEQFFDSAYPTTNAENLKTLIKEIVNFISLHKEFFLIILRLEGSEKTISKLKTFFYTKIFQESVKILGTQNIEEEYLNVETIFVISGIVGVIEKWLNEGLINSKENLMKYLHKIIMNFNP